MQSGTRRDGFGRFRFLAAQEEGIHLNSSIARKTDMLQVINQRHRTSIVRPCSFDLVLRFDSLRWQPLFEGRYRTALQRDGVACWSSRYLPGAFRCLRH